MCKDVIKSTQANIARGRGNKMRGLKVRERERERERKNPSAHFSFTFTRVPFDSLLFILTHFSYLSCVNAFFFVSWQLRVRPASINCQTLHGPSFSFPPFFFHFIFSPPSALTLPCTLHILTDSIDFNLILFAFAINAF